MSLDFDSIFETAISKHPGASERLIAEFLHSLFADVTVAEYPSSRRSESERWQIPGSTLPKPYLDFLRWSDGGEFQNGDRLMQFFSTTGDNNVREANLDYAVPRHSPDLLAFASDGGGNLYCFDMSRKDFPIHALEVGGPPAGSWPIEPSFMDAIQATTRIVDLC